MNSVSLVSLNIERSKHLPLVEPFLRQADADVVCLQELMEYDIPLLEAAIGAECYFAPSSRHPAEGKSGIIGLGMFSRLPVANKEQYYYVGSADEIRDFDMTDVVTKHASESRPLSRMDIEADGIFRICTTHFTWTPDGQPDDFQREDMKKMLGILERLGSLAMCGDFNAPRGGEIFAELASRYHDNIPAEYMTSLDLTLHRVGDTKPHELEDKMVDGLFTTPEYIAPDVKLVYGVSDHAAIVAALSKV